MNAKTTKIVKEARPLFWPWCAVAAAALLPLAHPPQLMEFIWEIGLFLGIPLLATLPLGMEFEHRTLPLLLSQPIGRTGIWGEKLSVTAVAVLSAALLFLLTLRETPWRQNWKVWALGCAWIVAITASATFWTLLTRSTVGGVVLNTGVQLPWAALATSLRARGYLAPGNPIVVASVVFVFVCYAGAMLWLGWRKLVRFQATGGMAGDDLLTAGADVMPAAWAGWLRCRPSGPALNLMRKELRLLRPVWLISLLDALGWACLTLFGLLHERGYSRNFDTAAVIVGVVSTLMIAILAGSLSLGEERTAGTHAWNLTLPVAARRQWLTKLCMALFAGFVGAWLLPMLIAGRTLFGSTRTFPDPHSGVGWLVVVLILTLVAFWCACALNGTVRAALWVVPVMACLYFAGELGKRAGLEFARLFFSRFDPYANAKFAHAVWRFSTGAFFRLIDAASTNMTDSVQASLALTPLLLTPTLLYVVIQSYRLFRAHVQDRALSVVRNLLPLALTAFLCTLSVWALYSFVYRAGWDPKRTAFFETIWAIQKIQPGAAKLDAAHPIQLTVDDLAKASPLSKSTRRLLGDSHITLALDTPPHHSQFGCDITPRPHSLSALGYSWYSYIIPLQDGSRFVVALDPVTHYIISAGICGGQLRPAWRAP